MAPTSKPLSPALIKAYADQNHISIDAAQQQLTRQAQQVTSSSTFRPWALGDNAESGVLYLGVNPGKPGTSPFGGVKHEPIDTTFQIPGTSTTQSVRINSATLPKGWTVAIETNAPSPSERGGMRLGEQDLAHVDVALVYKDEHGKVRYRQGLDPATKRNLFIPQTVIGPPGVPAISIDADAGELIAQTTGHGTKPTDKTATIEDQLKGIYAMPQAQLEGYKHQLWLAGYYGTKPLDQIDMKTITNDDVSAFGSLMVAAARYYAASVDTPGAEKLTWQELLANQSHSGSNLTARKGKPAAHITDPAAVIKEANETAAKVLGRGPNPQDVQAVLSLVESNQQQRREDANASGDVFVQTDPGADIEQYFRQKYPNEAQAVDWGDRASEWEALLRTPTSSAPPIVKADANG